MNIKDKYFEVFWKEYPRKVGKKYAKQVWDKKIKVEQIFSILEGLEAYKTSFEWLKDGGQFIPHPSTFLNGERWEDEVQDMSFLKSPETEEEIFIVALLNQIGIKNYLLSLEDLVQSYRIQERFISTIKSYCSEVVKAVTVLALLQEEFESKGYTWNPNNLAKNFLYRLEQYDSERYKRRGYAIHR